ncbi:MAG TPA: M3 family oligoendopeptidase [Bacteroidia bacterium]|jgi:M3 family oligoendopeptidase|nr:M3 family oligoendopeptidase [Bacteroidia bacterium]
MKFTQIPYQRPDIGSLASHFVSLIKDFDAANEDKQVIIISEINELRNHFETMYAFASIRYTQDTANKQYQDEQDFFDSNEPTYTGMVTEFYKALVRSKYKTGLEKKFGKQLFRIAEMKLRTFSPEVEEDLKNENRLTSEYTKLIASAHIHFDGKELSLSELSPYLTSHERDTRKNANLAKYKFFTEKSSELDRIYNELVKLRTTIARKLGFNTFTELAYLRMMRGDYNAQMVKYYRDQIHKYIVPLVTQLKQRQAKRLGLDALKYYDEALLFKGGNAKPKGDEKWILGKAKQMYNELSPKTSEFFGYMLDNELMDLVSRKNKAAGGYCSFLNEYKSPFIFANFNGTMHDVTVLTHEVGHAFQGYCSREYSVPEYFFPTYEACEIHSMSMEFLTWPWMKLFFEDSTDKFLFEHLCGALQFLPYGVSVDEFQHWVYDNPDATPIERKTQWRNIEKKYMPLRNYDGNTYLEEGGFWQQQGHIYQSPFYYIDYTLAQVCALQFWKRSNDDRKSALEDYQVLCNAGGSQSFLELVKLAKLTSPFEEGCLEKVTQEASKWIASIDESRLN